MKSLPKIILLTMVGLLSVFLIFGCSSNKNPSSSVSQGDPNDPNYVAAKAQIDELVASVSGDMAEGSDYLGGFNPPPSPTNATDTTYYGYDAETGWWYSYQDMNSDPYSYTYADSVRYSANGTFQENPDSTTDKMEVKLYTTMISTDSLYAYDLNFFEDMIFTVLSSDTLQTDGDGGYSIAFADTIGSFDFTETFNAIKIPIELGHPVSGTANSTMTATFPDGEGTWTINLTFYADHIHIYATNGQYYWEWDEYYEG